MILKSVRLHNIRSYIDAEIVFPEGSVLLSGDIGSGKSTVLLAIEFALFGIKRGQLSGDSLIRHGRKEGNVELHFEVDRKDIVVKRGLKRGKDDVQQDTGYVVIDGVKAEGTHVELKAKILELLGYPKELLTKSKDLVYRYTVYTPQEEMKQILLEHKDTRLDILRRIFNIDKYKRIRENSSVLMRDLRERMKKAEGQLSNLDEKKEQKARYGKEIDELRKKLDELAPEMEKHKKGYEWKKKALEEKEKELKEAGSLKSQLDVLEAELKSRLMQHEKGRKESEQLEKQLKMLEKELGQEEKEEPEAIKKKIKEMDDEYERIEKKVKEVLPNLKKFEIHKDYSKKLIDKISSLNKCPYCLQEVSPDHKEGILSKENKQLEDAEKHIRSHARELEEAEKALIKLKNDIRELKEKEARLQLRKVRQESFDEKRKYFLRLGEQQKDFRKEIGGINKKKMELNERLAPFRDVEKEHEQGKAELEELRSRSHQLELQKNSLEKETEGLARLVENIGRELLQKEKVRLELNHWLQMQNWLEKAFLSLMGVMEKHVMLQIYREFNEIFQKWFAVLVEDQNLSVRLDDEFSPVIEQNGFETTIENLSGGERTAVSLAYRLALNKVINDIISEIKTKDILILDEPTDGFSSEQLDKVRDVLEQLNVRQVILVSHESKIESFVDNVIHISKDEHVSSVI